MTTTYCPRCLDTWAIEPAAIARGDWGRVGTGVHLHVTCGRALEAIRTTPPTVEAEPEPCADLRWAS